MCTVLVYQTTWAMSNTRIRLPWVELNPATSDWRVYTAQAQHTRPYCALL